MSVYSVAEGGDTAETFTSAAPPMEVETTAATSAADLQLLLVTSEGGETAQKYEQVCTRCGYKVSLASSGEEERSDRDIDPFGRLLV